MIYKSDLYRTNYRGRYRRSDNYDRGRSSRDRQYSDNTSRNDRGSSRSRLGSRASMNRDRIRCCKLTEYEHFAKDCPTSNTGNV